jgi:hypothetical protein
MSRWCAPPVGDHAAAELPVPPPVRKVLVEAARAEHRGVATLGPRAEPRVPVEAELHRLLGQVARDGRVAEAAQHALDLPDRAVPHQLARDAELLHRSLHRARLQHPAVRVDRLHDLDGLVNVVGERLLAVDVLAGPQGGEGDDRVPVVGRRDHDGVDVLSGDELAEVVVGPAAGEPGRGPRRVELVHPRPGGLTTGRVDVADGDDAHALLVEKGPQEAPRLDAHPDEADAEPVARRGAGRPDSGGQDEGYRRDGLDDVSPCRLHEAPSRPRNAQHPTTEGNAPAAAAVARHAGAAGRVLSVSG